MALSETLRGRARRGKWLSECEQSGMTRPIWAGQYPIRGFCVNFTFFSSRFSFFVSPVRAAVNGRTLLRYGVLAEPVREEVGQVADLFRRFAAGGPNKRKRMNGNREVGKHFAQRS